MRFTLRTQKLALSIATGLCVLAVPTALLWIAMPLASVPDGPNPTLEQRNTSQRTVAPKGAVQYIASDAGHDVWLKRLRQPLYDAPPPQIVQKTLPPLQVALKGTIVEPGNSMAIIASPDGSIEYKKVGDPIGPPEGAGHLTEIHSDTIVVERGEKTESLKVTE